MTIAVNGEMTQKHSALFQTKPPTSPGIKTIAICASGPSLKREDCVKLISAGIPTIAINSSWEMIPECTYIYSGDYQWWRHHIQRVPPTPEYWTCSPRACELLKINYFKPDYLSPYNSGQRAILFAAHLGVEQIILLGFDCSLKNGTHWHGDHKETGNPTVDCTHNWKKQFGIVSDHLKDKVQITNCSRETELSCFRCASIDEVLTNNAV